MLSDYEQNTFDEANFLQTLCPVPGARSDHKCFYCRVFPGLLFVENTDGTEKKATSQISAWIDVLPKTFWEYTANLKRDEKFDITS